MTSVYGKIQNLITAANTVTGESDTTLTDAVQTLIDGYGQGGGSGEEYYMFKITPAETILTIEANAGSFTLGTYYAVYVYSTNSGNDPSHETVILGGRYHLPHNEMAATPKDYGRITTRKANSGSDYWNNPYITVTQTGTTLSIKGENSHGWWMGGVEYSFYIQNINAWETR